MVGSWQIRYAAAAGVIITAVVDADARKQQSRMLHTTLIYNFLMLAFIMVNVFLIAVFELPHPANNAPLPQLPRR
jgi:hypothetical protein